MLAQCISALKDTDLQKKFIRELGEYTKLLYCVHTTVSSRTAVERSTGVVQLNSCGRESYGL